MRDTAKQYTLEYALVEIWRQVLVENTTAVELDGNRETMHGGDYKLLAGEIKQRPFDFFRFVGTRSSDIPASETGKYSTV